GISVQQTTDGGFIIAGQTDSYGAGLLDVYLIRTDQNGNKVWEKTFGGSDLSRGAFVQQTTDGGYIIAGDTQTPTNNFDAYLIKTDPNGNLVWEKTFGGSDVEYAGSVQQTTDGGYVFAGYTYLYKGGAYQIYLVKTDQNGEEVWQNTFGGRGSEIGLEVRQTTDEGYIVVGDTQPEGIRYQNVCLIKTDQNGNKVWGKIFGGLKRDDGSSVQQTMDGGYIIAGSKTVPRSNTDCYLVKTDQNGKKMWEKTFGEITKINDCFSVQQTTDGGYIAVGYSQRPGGYSDVYLVYYRPDNDK
ncbi:MAG: hypothetical protein Q8M56_12750, partial [Desulfobacterales bacterium]|nr:hypothetical protein [Desulfobacterales bacterium]